MYRFKYKPSKAEAIEFRQKMEEIEEFCNMNRISASLKKDSYYFTLEGQKYRVSNHTVESRVEWGHNEFGIFDLVPKNDSHKEKDVIYITASKTRLIEIYNNLKAGKKLDKRGRVLEGKNEKIA